MTDMYTSLTECHCKPEESFSNLSSWLRDHLYLASLALLIVSLMPRLFLTMMAHPGDIVKPDSITYFAPAMNLLEHGAFLNRHNQPEVSRTPGYPAFLVAIMSFVGKDLQGEGLRRILIIQTVILSFSVLFLYWLARHILPPIMALTGALLAAFSPWGAVLAGLPLTEGLFVFLLALIFLLMKLVEGTRSMACALWGSLGIGLLTGATVLVRPMWPLLLFIAGGLFLRYGPRRQGAVFVLAAVVLSAAIPMFLWNARNVHEAGFHGLSDISGKAAWWCLASRVIAQANGSDADRFAIRQPIMDEDGAWRLSVQEADAERWRRAKEVFRKHPVLTVYSFALSVAEHTIHPSPDVLTSARLNFYGDHWVLAGLWGGFLVLAYLGWQTSNPHPDDDTIDRSWLLTILVICLLLTMGTGVSYGGGARLRAPLELIVPFLAGVGLVRVVRHFHHVNTPPPQAPSDMSRPS